MDSLTPQQRSERMSRVDILVHDDEGGTLTSYNVKRGNGSYDLGKRRLIQEDLLRTHMLLKDYGCKAGIVPTATHAHIVFYYDLLSLQPPLAIPGSKLDEHFGFPFAKP